MVPDRNFTGDFEQYVKGAVESIAGENARVVTEITHRIEIPESGKRQYVISEVSKFKYNPT